MAQAGLDTWQVLPLHPVGPGESPYASPSAFAADPRLISIEALVADGVLEPSPMPWGQARTDFDAVASWKIPLLRKAAGRVANDPACRAYVEAQRGWLEDWSLYAALALVHGGGWWDWPADAASRRDLPKLRKEHAALVAEEEALQWLFHVQWSRLRNEARALGIRLLGDIPIFVSRDGCDTWAHRDLFRLGADGRPDPVSGVPPDYFSPLGQRWGNPTYAWDRHAATGYAWWTERLRRELSLVDAVRLDHFRGFAASWSIPANEADARVGKWEAGPGRPLFDAMVAALGDLPIIAEDLGIITPDVAALRDGLALPGMKVLQFAYGGDGQHPFLPHNFEHPRWVAYTGTHDNDTTAGWYAAADERTRHRFRVLCARDGSAPAWTMMREVWGSIAETAIAPMQDFLGLDSDARLNTPGAADGNWAWRLSDLPWHVCSMSRTMGEVFGRTPGDSFSS